MSIVVPFPPRSGHAAAPSQDVSPATAAVASEPSRFARAIHVSRLTVAFFWPALRWMLAIDVAWQFVRAVLLWSGDGHPGLRLLVHFLVFVALTLFVAGEPRRQRKSS